MVFNRITLTRFIIEEQRQISNATGEFTSLLNDVATACKVVSNAVNHGALLNVLGSAGSENIQGEEQKKMDIIANDLLINTSEWAGNCAALASEEMDEIYQIPPQYPIGKYLLLFDPLDGSSNMDINGVVGTIFSILRYRGEKRNPDKKDFLQPGTSQVCAGYAIYGPQTMLVITTGNGVNGFTLDQNIGEFLLSHPDMKIPRQASEFAINTSYTRHWEPPVKQYIDECLAGITGPRKKDFNMRWMASLVAEVQRILTRGGVFLYPVNEHNREQGGKLRLMYEASPMAFIIEQAGGRAISGTERVMELQPTDLHQRVPLVLGSSEEVDIIESYHRAYYSS